MAKRVTRKSCRVRSVKVKAHTVKMCFCGGKLAKKSRCGLSKKSSSMRGKGRGKAKCVGAIKKTKNGQPYCKTAGGGVRFLPR